MTSETSSSLPLLVGREGAVATLRFNRPAALNAIDVPMATAPSRPTSRGEEEVSEVMGSLSSGRAAARR